MLSIWLRLFINSVPSAYTKSSQCLWPHETLENKYVLDHAFNMRKYIHMYVDRTVASSSVGENRYV